MIDNELNSNTSNNTFFEQEISELIHEQLLFTESIYARLPIGVEVYDTNGILRSINDYALDMYGVINRSTVINKVNLFESPYVDENLKKRIQNGENITLEFEYDFDRINKDSYYQSHNKNTMIYEVKIVGIWNKKGAIIGHMLLASDITSVKETEYRTEETKKDLELAMATAKMSSWVYDLEKKMFRSLYGTPIIKANMVMDDMLTRLHPQDRAAVNQLFSQLINKEIEHGQITLRFYNEEENQYRYYESRMRLSAEHLGRLQIVGTEMDVTEKFIMEKKTQDLLAKRELAMKVSNIVHWDFDVRTGKFESYNDPVNDYQSDILLTISEYLDVVHVDDQSLFFDAMQSMQKGINSNIYFVCRIQTKYDETWQYCDFTGIPFEWDENGNVIRFTGFRQIIPKLQKLNQELKDRSNKLELSFKTAGISYWDYEVKTDSFRAFNDPVNNFQSEKLFTPATYLKFAHPEDIGNLKKCINHMRNRIEQDFNFKYRSKTKWDKEWQTLLVTGIPVESDKDGH